MYKKQVSKRSTTFEIPSKLIIMKNKGIVMSHTFVRSIEFVIEDPKNGSDLLIKAREVDGSLEFDLSVLESEKQNAELKGLFFDFNDLEKLSGIKVTEDGGDVTSFGKDTRNFKDGTNVNGKSTRKTAEGIENEKEGYHFGVNFGTAGKGRDYIEEASFTLQNDLNNLTLDDIANVDFAAALGSSSSKLHTVAPAAPDAVDDIYNIYEDSSSGLDDPLTIPIKSEFELTSNDTDADGDLISIVEFFGTGKDGNIENGTVKRIDDNNDGIFEGISYTPHEDFSGTETFYYSVTDNAGGTDFAHVTINIEAVADIPGLEYTITKGSSVNQLIVSVTATQTDADGSEFIDDIFLDTDAIPENVIVTETFTYNTGEYGNDSGQMVKTYTINLPKELDTTFELGITAVSKEESNGDTEIAYLSQIIEYDKSVNDLSHTFTATDQSTWGPGDSLTYQQNNWFGLGGGYEGKKVPDSYDVTTDNSTSVHVASITEDDTINGEEAEAAVAVSGTTSGNFAQGDTVSFTVNSTDYSTTVQADGTWSVDVNGSDLAADTGFTVTAARIITKTIKDEDGNDIEVEEVDFFATADSTHSVSADLNAGSGDIDGKAEIDLGIVNGFIEADIDYKFGLQSSLEVSAGTVNAVAPYTIDLTSYYNEATDWLHFESSALVTLENSSFNTKSAYIEYSLELIAQLSGRVDFGVGVDIGGLSMPWPIPDIPGYENDWKTGFDIPTLDLALPLLEFGQLNSDGERNNSLTLFGLEGDGAVDIPTGDRNEFFGSAMIPDIATASKEEDSKLTLEGAGATLTSEDSGDFFNLGIDIDESLVTLATLLYTGQAAKTVNPLSQSLPYGPVEIAYDLIDYDIWGSLGIGQDFEMNLGEITATLMFEDGTESDSFVLGNDFDVDTKEILDTNDNGAIDYSIMLDPSATFQSNLNLVVGLHHQFKALEASVSIDVPIFDDPSFSLGPVFTIPTDEETALAEESFLIWGTDTFDFDLGSAQFVELSAGIINQFENIA